MMDLDVATREDACLVALGSDSPLMDEAIIDGFGQHI